MTTDNGSATAINFGVPPAPGARSQARLAATRAAGAPRLAPVARQPKAARVSAPMPLVGDILPREHFVAQLRREMRRADRTETSLSIVIFRVPQSASMEESAELRSLLQQSSRETDILGQLEPFAFALICTDTGREGVQHVISKIDARSGGMSYEAEAATYPDQLFQGLAEDRAPAPGSSPLFLVDGEKGTSGSYWLKRPLDIAGALVALLLLSPLMLLTALAVKLSSPGPIIYRQVRLGRGGRPFAFFKFRSMVANNDDRIHREYVANLIKGETEKVDQASSSGDGLRFKMKRDPRITWIGRIIRKTSIDELPQLFNVLRGDMSLVGPRPPLPYEAENYRSWHLRRVLDVRPGITGLWQVEGRSRVTFDEMVRMDLRYIRGCSLGLDLRILFRTVLVVVRGDGGG